MNFANLSWKHWALLALGAYVLLAVVFTVVKNL